MNAVAINDGACWLSDQIDRIATDRSTFAELFDLDSLDSYGGSNVHVDFTTTVKAYRLGIDQASTGLVARGVVAVSLTVREISATSARSSMP
jgi:hypothetical protein